MVPRESAVVSSPATNIVARYTSLHSLSMYIHLYNITVSGTAGGYKRKKIEKKEIFLTIFAFNLSNIH